MKWILLLIPAFAFSCNWFSKASLDPEMARYSEAVIVDKTGLDGCTYLINVGDTLSLDPINLPEEFKIHNLPVLVDYQENDSLMSTCMAGKLVKIIEIKKRKVTED